jgi:LysM repeat protein
MLMQRLACLFILLLVFGQNVLAQENPHYELIHIRLEHEMTQHEFAMQYNICWEQVHQHSYHGIVNTIPADTDLYFPPDILPCYNETGQRLIFYENGEPLFEPYYTDMQVYVTQPGETFESVSLRLNVCIEDITHQNEHYLFENTGADYASRMALSTQHFATGRELFIPVTLPCYADDGRKLKYAENGSISTLAEGRYYFLWDISQVYYLSYALNTCVDHILAANQSDAVEELVRSTAIVIPDNAPTCYDIYREEEFTPEALSYHLNVCISAIHIGQVYQVYAEGQSRNRYYVERDAPPCYDENGVLLVPVETGVEVAPSPVIVIAQGDTLETISRRYNVCAPDLLAANGKHHVRQGINFIIPETRPCYNEAGLKLLYPEDDSAPIAADLPVIIAGGNGGLSLQNIAWDNNICLEELLAANPHLNIGDGLYWGGYYTYYWDLRFNVSSLMADYGSEVFIPVASTPCGESFVATNDEELWDLAQQQNVCIEQLRAWLWGNRQDARYMIPHQREVCYDENGHRLSYFDDKGVPLAEPIRINLDIYVVPHVMSTYELSRRLNVCVNDLLVANPILEVRLPYTHLEVFIPATSPCYDEATGKQLIYKDENGQPLAEPILSEYLIHQVTSNATWGRIGQMYNVCPNRVEDFNEGFLPNVWTVNYGGFPGYIARIDGIFDIGVYVRIPTDRPPCYEYGEGTRWLRYVCYDTLLDMAQANPDAVINPHGTHCYDIEDPTTVIWHEGDRYLYQKREGTLYSNDFMAWCFGVGEDDIIAASENPIVYIIPYEELLVRNPTRTCYVREDDGAENVHWVESGETLRTIAWHYGKLPSWIATANNLSDANLIWEYQRLIIPEGINLWHVFYAIPTTGVLMLCLSYLFKRRQGLTGTKKKRKPNPSADS